MANNDNSYLGTTKIGEKRSFLSPVGDPIGKVLNKATTPVGHVVGGVTVPITNIVGARKEQIKEEEREKERIDALDGKRFGGKEQTGGNPLGL